MSVQKLAPALIGVLTGRLREIFASVTRTCVQKVLMVSRARVTANVIVILVNVDVKKVRINSYNPYSYILILFSLQGGMTMTVHARQTNQRVEVKTVRIAMVMGAAFAENVNVLVRVQPRKNTLSKFSVLKYKINFISLAGIQS